MRRFSLLLVLSVACATQAEPPLKIDPRPAPTIQGPTHGDARLLRTTESFDYDCSDKNHYKVSYVRGPGNSVRFTSLMTGQQVVGDTDRQQLNEWLKDKGRFSHLTAGCGSNGLTVDLAMDDGAPQETSAVFHLTRGKVIAMRVMPRMVE